MIFGIIGKKTFKLLKLLMAFAGRTLHLKTEYQLATSIM